MTQICVEARACPEGGKCIFEDKSFKEFFRYLLRSTDLLGALLNLVLPCTQCEIFVQKYKRHGLMFNVCVLLLLAPEKAHVVCYVTVHTVNKAALVLFFYELFQ